MVLAGVTRKRGGIDRRFWWLPHVAVLYLLCYVGVVALTPAMFGGDLGVAVDALVYGTGTGPFYWGYLFSLVVVAGAAVRRVVT
ncbi:MAG: hypothetical protein ABEJ42_04395 [Halobacteriaceae archaeon]